MRTDYNTTERECLAVVEAVKQFRACMWGRFFTVVVDHHSLPWPVISKNCSGVWLVGASDYRNTTSKFAKDQAINKQVPMPFLDIHLYSLTLTKLLYRLNPRSIAIVQSGQAECQKFFVCLQRDELP